MKKLVRLVCLVLAVVMTVGVLPAAAALPQGYWPYLSAYTSAKASGDHDAIIKAGDEYLAFYAKFGPVEKLDESIQKDVMANYFNVYRDRYTMKIFEQRGDYASAIDNAQKLYNICHFAYYTLGEKNYYDWLPQLEAYIRKARPMAEVYAVTTNTANYPYYGAMYEPESGTYFGRVERRNSNTKSENYNDLKNESVVSFYVEVGGNTAKDFAWKIDGYSDYFGSSPCYTNGDFVVHIALNFPDEATTAAEVVAGKHDSNIKETLDYLNTLDCPVMLRIGAEMNVWTNAVEPETFKNAYIHIAKMARTYAPNAALVFSPNYTSGFYTNVEDFYPGDEYVDWVGLSLYMVAPNVVGSSADAVYFGQGEYCDVIRNGMEVIETFKGKPVMITEGGALHTLANGTSYNDFAVEQTYKMYSVLNMVYPQVKAIVTFDVAFNGNVYTLSANSAVKNAHDTAVANNPTLINNAQKTASAYVKVSDFCEKTDTIKLAAYADTLFGKNETVTYYLDGVKLTSAASLPYNCTINAAALAAGNHTLKAVFADDAKWTETRTYSFTKLADGTVTFGAAADTQMDGWAAPEVNAAIELGLVKEKFQTRYKANITRADFCELAIDVIEAKYGIGIDEILEMKGLKRNYGVFSDTMHSDILAANALGIVNGRSGKVFDPNAEITRQEAAKMLAVTAQVLGISAPTGEPVTFLDSAEFPAWAADYISFISGIKDGTNGKAVMGGSNGRFDHWGKYTREQAYLTMLRLYNAA